MFTPGTLGHTMNTSHTHVAFEKPAEKAMMPLFLHVLIGTILVNKAMYRLQLYGKFLRSANQ